LPTARWHDTHGVAYVLPGHPIIQLPLKAGRNLSTDARRTLSRSGQCRKRLLHRISDRVVATQTGGGDDTRGPPSFPMNARDLNPNRRAHRRSAPSDAGIPEPLQDGDPIPPFESIFARPKVTVSPPRRGYPGSRAPAAGARGRQVGGWGAHHHRPPGRAGEVGGGRPGSGQHSATMRPKHTGGGAALTLSAHSRPPASPGSHPTSPVTNNDHPSVPTRESKAKAIQPFLTSKIRSLCIFKALPCPNSTRQAKAIAWAWAPARAGSGSSPIDLRAQMLAWRFGCLATRHHWKTSIAELSGNVKWALPRIRKRKSR
jgi:hypothetical protein